MPSVLWHCWLGGRKGIRPVIKTERWGAGVVICLERCADLHMAQLMPLPLTVSCFRKIQICFTFLVPAHPGSPGQRAVKWVCVRMLLNVWIECVNGRARGSQSCDLRGGGQSGWWNVCPPLSQAEAVRRRRRVLASGDIRHREQEHWTC